MRMSDSISGTTRLKKPLIKGISTLLRQKITTDIGKIIRSIKDSKTLQKTAKERIVKTIHINAKPTKSAL